MTRLKSLVTRFISRFIWNIKDFTDSKLRHNITSQGRFQCMWKGTNSYFVDRILRFRGKLFTLFWHFVFCSWHGKFSSPQETPIENCEPEKIQTLYIAIMTLCYSAFSFIKYSSVQLEQLLLIKFCGPLLRSISTIKVHAVAHYYGFLRRDSFKYSKE